MDLLQQQPVDPNNNTPDQVECVHVHCIKNVQWLGILKVVSETQLEN